MSEGDGPVGKPTKRAQLSTYVPRHHAAVIKRLSVAAGYKSTADLLRVLLRDAMPKIATEHGLNLQEMLAQESGK